MSEDENKKFKEDTKHLEEEWKKAGEEGDIDKQIRIGKMIDSKRPLTKWEKAEGVRFI